MTAQGWPNHIRADTSNLVTIATKTSFPEQKDTIHTTASLRTEACSGQIDDTAHVTTVVQLVDRLTKGKPTHFKGLQQAVTTSVVPNIHHPFKTMMKQTHWANIALWLSRNTRTTERLPEGIHEV